MIQVRLDEQDYEQYVPAHDHQIPPVDLLVQPISNISMMTEFQYNKASLVVTEEANFWESFSIFMAGMLHVGRIPTSMCVLTIAIKIYLVFWKTVEIFFIHGLSSARGGNIYRNRNALEKEH